MKQFGFFIDLSRCIGCQACVIACKQWHNISPSPVKWLRVFQWEKGSFPDIRVHILPIMCLHCQNPVCVKACPNGAIYKEEKYGAVLVNAGKCKGERKCWQACPYGVPQFSGEQLGLTMSKCNMCIDRLEDGKKPICVLSCSLRALEFGPLDELRKKYGEIDRVDDMPDSSITKPSVVFKPSDSKKQIVPWDWKRTLELWRVRISDDNDLLPDVFSKVTDVTQVPVESIGRSKLILKSTDFEQMTLNTMDDE